MGKRVSKIDDDMEVEKRVIEVDPQDAKVRKIFAAMPGGLKCLSVFRYPEGNKGGRPQYLDDITPDQFDFQTIKAMFGGGRFFVRWDNEDGTETKSNFDIAGPYMNFDGGESQSAQHEPETITMPQQVQQGQVQPSIDPMMLMKMMREAEDRGEQRMLKMMEIMRPVVQAPPPQATDQVFSLVEKIVPLIGQGGGDGMSPWLIALNQFREPIMKIVEAVSTAATRPSYPMSGPPPQPAVQPNPPKPPTPEEPDMIKLLIRQYLPVFVNAARSHSNPDIYADMVLEQVPENLYPKLASWLNSPTWFQDITAIEKNVEFQAGWWNLLRTSILEGMTPEDAESNVQPSGASEELSED